MHSIAPARGACWFVIGNVCKRSANAYLRLPSWVEIAMSAQHRRRADVAATHAVLQQTVHSQGRGEGWRKQAAPQHGKTKKTITEDRHFTAHYDRLSTPEAAGFSREKEHEQHSRGTCTCEANASSGASNLDCRDRRALPKIDDGAVNSVNLLFIFACGVCVTKNRSSIFGGHVPDFGMNHEQNLSFVVS